MSGLMIYLPGHAKKHPHSLVDAGAGELLDPGATPLFIEAMKGPDGGRGWLVIFDCPARPFATPQSIDVKTQRWLASEGYWIGCETASPPGPAELERAKIFDGRPVVLEDQKPWVVPVADYLPQRLSIDRETGDEIRVPKAEHAEFVIEANRIFEHLLSDGFQAALDKNVKVQVPGGFRFAALAIAKNYRVNADVVDLLELVDEQQAVEISMTAIGLRPFLDLAEKKNGSDVAPPPANSS